MFFKNKYGFKKTKGLHSVRKKKLRKNNEKKPYLKKNEVSSFSKLQTCIQINKNTKVKKKHFIFIIRNNNLKKTHMNKK